MRERLSYMRGLCVSLCVLGLLLSVASCQKEDMLGRSTAEITSTKEANRAQALELVSVTSSGKGQAVRLRLNASIEDDNELRAKTYADEEDSGAYAGVQISGLERAHCILRRKGDERATTYVDIAWQGRSDRRIRFDNIVVHLPEGIELSADDEWYFTAIMGGDSFDRSTGEVAISPGMPIEGANLPQMNAASLEKIPYFVNWTKLEVSGKDFSMPSSAKFSALGTLLRLQFASNMVEGYQAKTLSIKTNAMNLSGRFLPMATADEELDAPPRWPLWQADASDQGEQTYLLKASGISPEAQALELHGGAGFSNERTIYVWGVPIVKEDDAEPLSTEVHLEVIPLDASTNLRATRQKTYEQKGHRPFRQGATYRLSNVLTSDLIISEIFYDYAEAEPNATQRANYSIVELYNPTLSNIDLNQYALARLRYDRASNSYAFHSVQTADLRRNPLDATLLQLGIIMGSSWNKTFGDRVGRREGEWRRPIYTQGSIQPHLAPGQTLLIGAGGYIRTKINPDKNIELFDLARRQGLVQDVDFTHRPGTIQYESSQERLRNLEKSYYPHAGRQPDSAVRLGYCHTLTALDNGPDVDASPEATQGGTLQLGMGQALALIKYEGVLPDGHLSDSKSYVIKDVTAPILSDATSYRSELLTALQGQGLSLNSIDEQTAVDYAYSRPRYDDFPHADFAQRLGEWSVATSENTGAKSLGTRYYMAGLSPFRPNYSGYSVDNNPLALPFWATLQRSTDRPIVPQREWYAPPTRGGGNAFSAPIGDIVTIVYADAPAQPGEDISRAFDGDYQTLYHSPYNKRPAMPFPIDFHFAKAEQIDYMLYAPRRDTGVNGRLLEVDLEYSLDGQNFVPLKKLTFENSPEEHRINFDEAITAKAMRLIVRRGVGNFATIAEIQFGRKTKAEDFDWRDLFTDESCGVLREGVSAEDIKNCPHPLYRNIAQKLSEGKYDEFRVAEYKPYPNPRIIAQATKTWPYSLRDNPTGISVQAGDILVVRVAEDYKNLRIVVQNLDHPNNDGFGGKEYPLRKGENRIAIREKGLVYVLYIAESMEALAAAQPIRIHFVTGQVNGYYDSQNTKHHGRWKELLSKAIDPYFDVLGEHAHLTYPTWRFRTQTQDGHALIDTYDQIVKAEKELLGMYRYDNPQAGIYRLPRNRMYLSVVYRLYMYATHHYTGFNDKANALSLSAEPLKNGVWGVAHEIGHINQTRPGLSWQGMDEVTVNIKSLYVQTSLFGKESRWQRERDRLGRNRWYKSWNTILRNGEYHGLREDGSPKLTPFWQLELYFGNVLGRTPMRQSDKGGFYPELYELIRQEPNLTIPPGQSNAPMEQSEFVRRASQVAGYDLTDFFEKWGFLKTGTNVEMKYDYGRKFNYTLTQERVDDVKRRIKALNLPPLPVALEFITDVNVELFKRRQPIVRGTVAKQKRKTFLLDGWENIVAFEFVADDGRVLEYKEALTDKDNPNRYTVTLSNGDVDEKIIPSTNFILRAIAYDGTREEVGRFPDRPSPLPMP